MASVTIKRFITIAPYLDTSLCITCPESDSKGHEWHLEYPRNWFYYQTSNVYLAPNQNTTRQIIGECVVGTDNNPALLACNEHLTDASYQQGIFLIYNHFTLESYDLGTGAGENCSLTPNSDGTYCITKTWASGKKAYLDATDALANNSRPLILTDATEIKDEFKFVVTEVSPVLESLPQVTGIQSVRTQEPAISSKYIWYDNKNDETFKTYLRVPLNYYASNGGIEHSTQLTKTIITDGVESTETSDRTAFEELTLTKETDNSRYIADIPAVTADTTKKIKKWEFSDYYRTTKTLTETEFIKFPDGISYTGTVVENKQYLTYLPDLSIRCVFSPKGLYIVPTCDYVDEGYGSMRLWLKPKENNIVRSPISKDYTTPGQTFLVGQDRLASIPTEGSTIAFDWIPQTDINSGTSSSKLTKTATIEYEGGTVSAHTLTIDYSDKRNATLKAVVSDARVRNCECWLLYGGKRYKPLTSYNTGSLLHPKAVFEIAHPFNKDFTVLAIWQEEDGDHWQVMHQHVSATQEHIHAFNWDGGSAIIWMNKNEALEVGETNTPVTTETQYGGRLHPTVQYLQVDGVNVTNQSGQAKGYLLNSDPSPYGTTRVDIRELAKVGNCIYRMPTGEIFECAVTGTETTVQGQTTAVTVNWQRQSLETELYSD